MAATTHPMTVAKFRQLPEDQGPIYHELRHGEIIPVTRPKFKHFRIQKQLEKLLEPIAHGTGVVAMEFAFRPLPEHELWVADVAYVSQKRWDGIDPEDNLAGAPEMVIEVLSPSNSAAEIYDEEKLCLENGAQEFWVLDADRRQVKVSTPDGHTMTYQTGQEIPLPLFRGAKVAVDAIFA
jgi:Uma2 family endonuclease